MKHAAELLTTEGTLSQNSPECPGTNQPHDREFIAGLLLSFAAIWGSKFNPGCAAMPLLVDLWASGLEEMTRGEIRERFKVCKKTMDWPPNVSEFLGTESSKPKSQDEWAQFGRRIGFHAGLGESWDSYIGKLRGEWDRQPWRIKKSASLGYDRTNLLDHDR